MRRMALSLFGRFAGDKRGSTAVMLSLALPVALGGGVVAMEYTRATADQSYLQTYADAAALAAARELRLGNATEKSVLMVASNNVAAQAAGDRRNIAFSGSVAPDKSWVQIDLSAPSSTGLGAAMGLLPATVSAHARARVSGGAPVCLVGLDNDSNFAIQIDKNAHVKANACAVYSNSTKPNGLIAMNNALLEAAFICTAGGRVGGRGNYSPDPQTDCPKLPDPLAARPAPTVAGCDPGKSKLTLAGQSVTLFPGVYCEGLKITGGSNVVFSPGVYVIKDGPLIVDGGASVSGTNVGFYFTGDNAGMRLAPASAVSFTAPKDGVMTGLLFFQDRTMRAEETYEISSDNASVLLGTFYLPKGRLHAGGSQPVAQNSAYTIIVASRVTVSEGPVVVLNSNYSATDVPVPDGVGPLGAKVLLEK